MEIVQKITVALDLKYAIQSERNMRAVTKFFVLHSKINSKNFV